MLISLLTRVDRAPAVIRARDAICRLAGSCRITVQQVHTYVQRWDVICAELVSWAHVVECWVRRGGFVSVWIAAVQSCGPGPDK